MDVLERIEKGEIHVDIYNAKTCIGDVEVDKELFRLAKLGQRMQWQGIESAPKDGARIIVCVKGLKDSQGEAAFINNEWRCPDSYQERTYTGYVVAPTHWMPLPPNPGEGE